MDFNINYYVHVKLTDLGRKIHRERYDALTANWRPHVRVEMPYRAPEVDAEGYSKFQLWDLMATFGPQMGLACDLSFETTIRIPEGQS